MAERPPTRLSGVDAEFLRDPPRDPAPWEEVWERDLAFPIASHRGALGSLVVFFKRLFRPLVRTPINDLFDRQRVFNLVQLEYARRLLRLEGRVNDELEALRERVLPAAVKRSDALYTMLDIKLEAALEALRALEPQLAADRSDLARALVALRGGDAAEGAAALQAVASRAGDRRYVEFERAFRGTPREIAERLAGYVERFAGVPGPVLDLGCGRGEFLALLREAGVPGRGVDGNAAMVAECRGRGLAVVEGDLFAALEAEAARTLGGVTSFQVVEHIESEDVERLLLGAWRALAPGGVLLLETPDPRSIKVGASNFWIDPTHRRPVHPESLAFRARSLGFCDVEILAVSPFAAAELLPAAEIPPGPPELRQLAATVNELADRLNDIVYSPQDYALFAKRP